MQNVIQALEIITKFVSLPIIIPLMISMLFFTINNINITDIEKMFLTNHQRLQIVFSSILINFIIGSISMAFPLYSELINAKDKKLVLLSFFLIVFIVSVIPYIIMCLVIWLNPIKSTASINDGTEEWKILRVISKSQVLLSRKAEGNTGCHRIVTYRELKSVKEQKINILYGLKNDIYSIFVRKLSVRGRKFMIIRNTFAIASIIILLSILDRFNTFKIILILLIIFLIVSVLVINIHILYLKKANKLHPEIFMDSIVN
ncbi:hypothetical protein COM73_21040 [Bacillus thuringiensis]|nr:hypothetical protein COM73_21040 [Bacillus thuringiensis]